MRKSEYIHNLILNMLYYPPDPEEKPSGSTNNDWDQLVSSVEQDDNFAQYQYHQNRKFKFIAGSTRKFTIPSQQTILSLEPGKTYSLEFKIASRQEPFLAEWRNQLGKPLFFSETQSSTGSAPFVAMHKLIFSPYDRTDCQISLHTSTQQILPESNVIVCQLSRDKIF